MPSKRQGDDVGNGEFENRNNGSLSMRGPRWEVEGAQERVESLVVLPSQGPKAREVVLVDVSMLPRAEEEAKAPLLQHSRTNLQVDLGPQSGDERQTGEKLLPCSRAARWVAGVRLGSDWD